MIRSSAAILAAVIMIGLSVYALAAGAFQSAAPYDNRLAQEPAQFAQRYLSLLGAKKWDAVLALSDESWRNAKARSALAAISDMTPRGKPDAIHVAGFYTHKSFRTNFSSATYAETEEITLEYIYPTKTILAAFLLQHDGSSFLVRQMNIKPLPAPLEQYHEFYFLGQSALSYAVLSAAILLLAFNIYALVQCIMTPDLRFKWLWIPFVAVGFLAIRYDWTDAVFSYKALAMNVPAADFALSAFQPFMIRLSLPVGAVLFLLWRRIHAAYGAANQLEYE
jgi:hypothetical protein